MNTRLLLGAILLWSCAVGARSIFTPLTIQWVTDQRMLDDKAYSPYAQRANDKDYRKFVVDLWGVGFSRSADTAYSCNGNCQVPLSTVIFGQPSFTLGQTFAQNTTPAGSNPWLGVVTVKPDIAFLEQGILFRAQWRAKSKKHPIRFGVRAQLPVETLKMSRNYNSNDAQTDVDALNSVRRLVTEVVPTGPGSSVIIGNSFAYRLDFLSKMLVNNSTAQPLVAYSQTPLRMGSVNVTDSNSVPVNVIKRTSTTPPNLPYSAVQATVATTPALSANGAGLNNNDRAHFAAATSYAPLGAAQSNQAQLWAVPTVVQNADGTYTISANAANLRTQVEGLLPYWGAESLVNYLDDHGLNLNTQDLKGVGDLQIQPYVNYNWNARNVMCELTFGVSIPTGVCVRNPLCVLAQPLGNNGHVELYPGLELMWHACDWFGLSADFAYHWVLKHQESVATPLCGACVKNIGTCTKADISWNYGLIHANAIFVEPVKQEAGVNIGYEFYQKTFDKCCFCGTMGLDLEGTCQRIDPNIIACLTRVIAQKISAEFFINKPQWGIFGGFDWVFAGKNAPKETCFHLGALVEF